MTKCDFSWFLMHFVCNWEQVNKYDCIPFRVSVFKDKCTPSPFVEEFPEDDGEAARAALPDHIYMDAMGFGMGNCCLQVLKKTPDYPSLCCFEQ